MKRAFLAALAALMLLGACRYRVPAERAFSPGDHRMRSVSSREEGQEKNMKDFRIITATDLHFISPVLTDQGE